MPVRQINKKVYFARPCLPTFKCARSDHLKVDYGVGEGNEWANEYEYTIVYSYSYEYFHLFYFIYRVTGYECFIDVFLFVLCLPCIHFIARSFVLVGMTVEPIGEPQGLLTYYLLCRNWIWICWFSYGHTDSDRDGERERKGERTNWASEQAWCKYGTFLPKCNLCKMYKLKMFLANYFEWVG